MGRARALVMVEILGRTQHEDKGNCFFNCHVGLSSGSHTCVWPSRKRGVRNRATVLTVEGVVKQYEWTNPHTWLYVTVANDKGEIAEWAGEAGAPGMLARRGWTSHSFKPGDKVKMSGRPAKNGSKQMLITKVQSDVGVLQ